MEEARAELDAFDALGATIPEDWSVGNNPVAQILPLARGMFLGEIQFREGRRDEAFDSLRAAVAIEDRLAYDEPPGWMQPVRHALGALLLVDERFEEALDVYRADLGRNPNNGWALLGLEQSLAGLGRGEEARLAARSREAVWSRADEQPTASCYCGQAR
jgi:tetratricopeptide (TPR) repeat protein